jgi:hypothetical protein
VRLAAAVAGDIGQTRTRALDDLEGVSSSEVEITAHIWTGDITPAELECDLTDSDTGTITIDFGSYDGWLANDATAGVWLLVYEVVFGDGDRYTLPAIWPDEIRISDYPEVPTP